MLLAALTVTLGAGQAHAAGYRYWSFWDRDTAKSTWTYATQGPSVARPDDGDVQGFRFAVSADSKNASEPRGTASFAGICADTPARDGSKRVALVLDFGTRADAPGGEHPPKGRTACARVAEDATTADALASVAKPLRYDASALLCAVSGYPGSGCGEQVKDGGSASESAKESPVPSADGSRGSGGPSVGLIAGIAAVVVLGGAAFWQSRRRGRS
ncbi:hypothetical protein GBW32_09830 [Streptomyces tsukubensis]|uniref:Secreted protein n=1 Tax=Streptomyces tsukubensis TaxID=83656 RepID=A0A1V4A5P0_9ACTN|nr:SCO2322 family protein [Streptomyces tsukubensis]OON76742.1 hypothetical protein B1H18_20520 [Streptomyces tsukubensis]QFR97636.1 hypothetical protein GBW32_09830 [Streptomyces tsukubensis]